MLTPVYTLRVKKSDDNPSVVGVRTIEFTNGTLVNAGNGRIQFTAPEVDPGDFDPAGSAAAALVSANTYTDNTVAGYVPITRTVNGHALSANVTIVKADIGLGNVENIALSTWVGSTNLTTLGTITTGVWNGTALISTYLPATVAYTNTVNTFALGQAITQGALTGTVIPSVTVTDAAHTLLTASTERISVNLNLSSTKQWATGALAAQREVLIQAPTYSAVAASVFTTAGSFVVSGAPIAGTNVTITNPYAIWIQSGESRFAGNVGVPSDNVIAENLIARQDGGVANTDDTVVSHDGTNGQMEAKSGKLVLRAGATNVAAVNGTFGIVLHSGLFVGWSGSSDPTANPDTNLYRPSAALLQVCGASSNTIGAIKVAVLVEANTAGSGAPNVLAATESRTVLTNEGASAENYHTLPAAAAGLDFTFVVQDADGIRVKAAAGDTIRIGAVVSAAAGFVRSATAGNTLRLVAINSTEWVAFVQGTWTIDV